MKRLHPGGPSFDAIYIYIDTHSAFPLDAWRRKDFLFFSFFEKRKWEGSDVDGITLPGGFLADAGDNAPRLGGHCVWRLRRWVPRLPPLRFYPRRCRARPQRTVFSGAA